MSCRPGGSCSSCYDGRCIVDLFDELLANMDARIASATSDGEKSKLLEVREAMLRRLHREAVVSLVDRVGRVLRKELLSPDPDWRRIYTAKQSLQNVIEQLEHAPHWIPEASTVEEELRRGTPSTRPPASKNGRRPHTAGSPA